MGWRWGIEKVKQGLGFSPFSFGRRAGDEGLRAEAVLFVVVVGE
jgi:hypothetical protein